MWLKLVGTILLAMGVLPILAESLAYLVAIIEALQGGELRWPQHALPAMAHIAYPLVAYLGAACLFPNVVPARAREIVAAFRRKREES